MAPYGELFTATPVTVQESPTMPGHPLVGSAWDLLRRLLPTQEHAMRLGDVVRFAVGPPGARVVIYSVYAPDGAQRVLTARDGYRKDNRCYRQIRALIGDGLLTSQDETWVRQKRSLQPLFVQSQMREYGRIVTEEAAALVDRWRSSATADKPGIAAPGHGRGDDAGGRSDPVRQRPEAHGPAGARRCPGGVRGDLPSRVHAGEDPTVVADTAEPPNPAGAEGDLRWV